MTQLRVALCQLDPVVGDIEGNVERVLCAMARADAVGADLAVFPELVLTGYPPEDLLLKPAFVERSVRALEAVAAASKRCASVIGFVEPKGGLYNAAAVVSGGKVHGVWHKELLPNYGVFDERRWFTPGDGATPLFGIAGVAVAITICEDAWSPEGPIARQAAGGADLVVSLNASPYRAEVIEEREGMLATRAADASAAIVYVNLVGGQDELVFDGGSMIFDHTGKLLARLAQFDELVEIVDIDLASGYPKRTADPDAAASAPPLPLVDIVAPSVERSGHYPPTIVQRPDVAGEVYDALVLATRDYVRKNRFSDVVIGLSGGIDSALVAAIAVDALGADRVHGVLLPSRYSSAGSIGDANALAENLGIEHRVISIEGPFEAYLEVLEEHFTGRTTDLTEENLQARVRGTILMALSNKFGWIVLTTGNKSEIAVGYSTLYGDMAGGFAVIGDVPKTLVYAVARARNHRAGMALIPDAIIDKAPSAELRPDQKDEDSLPPYEVLDPILEEYVERDRSVDDIVAKGFDESVVRRVIALVDGAEYKRRQAPPGARVTSRAFGKDRRMPITNGSRTGELQ
ncbi:MAG TPA: NAD+ synthase [Acidimicrobiales bacterium]|nr:NAD+ synthase [Acidimicrobiales bacterium]